MSLVFGETEPPDASMHRPYAYLGWDAAGHLREVLEDRGREADAHTAAGWAMAGLVVERLPVDDGLPEPATCNCPTANQPELGL